MLTPLTIVDLDSIRAETMMALLNKEGRTHIWRYDIVPRKEAARLAVYDQNYDCMEAARVNKDKPFALIGPGIEDTYFGTVAELISCLLWLCTGYLGCYAVKHGETYSNQQEFLTERESYPFIPLKS